MRRVTKFTKNGTKKVVYENPLYPPRLRHREWTLEDALPQVIEIKKSFEDINSKKPKKPAKIIELRNAIGDAVLLFIANMLIPTQNGRPGNTVDYSVEYYGSQAKPLIRKKLWDIVMKVVYDHEYCRRHTAKKKSIAELKEDMKAIEIAIDRLGNRSIKAMPLPNERETWYDKIIKPSEIHAAKAVDLKKAIPIKTETSRKKKK